jgi:DNA-binding transcriptional ArsR family regulator
MSHTADIAAIGRLLAVPARAAMVDVLFDGRAWSVTALADAARVARSTASEHLQLLERGGLVTGARDGRARRYRLASEDVASALERLSAIAPPRPVRGLRAIGRAEALRDARTCYDHLAGRLGVAVSEGLVRAGVLRPSDQAFAPTTHGTRVLSGAGIDVEQLARARRPLTRACLDWSERRPHLAGALGAALVRRLEEVDGLERIPGGRAVRLVGPGDALLARLGVRAA